MTFTILNVVCFNSTLVQFDLLCSSFRTVLNKVIVLWSKQIKSSETIEVDVLDMTFVIIKTFFSEII